MAKGEKIELGVILLFIPALYFAAYVQWLPPQVRLSSLILMASSLLLLHSLVRDLILLRSAKLRRQQEEKKYGRCMCLESTLGMVGIVSGSLFLFSGLVDKRIGLSAISWLLLSTAILFLGYFIKDLVLTWKPLAIKRDKDHLNIIVRWK